MPKTKVVEDLYGREHYVEVPTLGEKIKDFVGTVKDVVGDIGKRGKAIRLSEKLIEELKNNPDSKKADEIIQKVYSSISGLELTDSRYGSTISYDSVESFLNVLQTKEGKEMQDIARSVESHLSCHPDAKTRASKNPTKEEPVETIESEPGE